MDKKFRTIEEQIEIFNSFYKSLIRNIEQLKKSIKTIKIDTILKKMGFPNNYSKLLKL